MKTDKAFKTRFERATLQYDQAYYTRASHAPQKRDQSMQSLLDREKIAQINKQLIHEQAERTAKENLYYQLSHDEQRKRVEAVKKERKIDTHISNCEDISLEVGNLRHLAREHGKKNLKHNTITFLKMA